MKQSGISFTFEKNREKIRAFLCSFVIVTVFFGGLIRRSYNADTITYMVYAKDDADVRVRAGRYIIALIDVIFYKLGIKTTDFMPVCIILSLVILAATMALLQNVFKPFFISDNVILSTGIFLATALSFCNVLFIEYFMFTEMTLLYVIAFFLATVGVHLFIDNKKLTAYLLLAVTVCIYQLAIVYAAIVLLFYYMLQHNFEWSMKAVMDEFLGVSLPLSLGVINMVSIKIVGTVYPDLASKKPYGSESFLVKLRMAFNSMGMYAKDSYTLLPTLFIPGILFVLSVILVLIILLKTRGVFASLYFGVALIVGFIVIFIIPILGTGFTFPPRMSFLLYAFQGLILITAILLLANEESVSLPVGKEILLKCISYALVGYILLQAVTCSFIIAGRYVSNTLDKNYSRIILEEIEKYENNTGTAVTKLAFINDGFAPAYYEESRIHYDQINERIMGQSTRSMFEVFWDRHFDAAKMSDEVYDQYFAGKNWDYFDVNEQLVIVDDTAYLCVY